MCVLFNGKEGLSLPFQSKTGFVVKHLTACKERFFADSNILQLFYVEHIFLVNNKIIKPKAYNNYIVVYFVNNISSALFSVIHKVCSCNLFD